jgi:hypothetical protein
LEEFPKGAARALIQEAFKLEKRDSEYWDTNRRGMCSTAKDKIIRVKRDHPARGQEGDAKKRKHIVL